ncbi:MAG: PAS domain S-box protein, partial [Gemmataceae bacterium]
MTTLLGYAFDMRRLTDWNNDNISMFPNAAACAALSGLALLLLPTTGHGKSRASRIAVRVIASAVGLVGGLTLLEHLSGVNLGIDTLLAERTWGQEAAGSPMRIGPPASTSYLLIGAGLLLSTFEPRAKRFASALGIVVVVIASLSLIGYWFGSKQFFAARLTGIALQTSTTLAAIGVGLIASLPDHGMAAMLRRDDAGGVTVRRLLLPIIIIPLVFGWLRVLGQDAGYFDTAFGTAALALLVILMLFSLLWWTAAGLSRQAHLTRAAEQAIRDSEARHRALLEASVYGVLTINERGIIESANPAAERLFGYSSGEMIGHNISMLMPQPYQGEHDSYLENYRRTGVRKIIGIGREVAGRRKDGSTFPMDLAVAESRLGGKRHFQGLVHDISERKRAEEALNEADRRKNEFLATLAHELRNPLAPIRNANQILLVRDPPDPDLKWAQEVIDRQVQHMARLLDDLLDVSRITHNKLELRKDRVQLSAVIQSAIETSRPLLDNRQQELAVTVPPEPVYLDADPVRLAQVFSNLLNNAAKYSEPGGHIQITCERPGSDVVVSVKDDGIGFAAEMVPRLFDIFSQSPRALERSQGGLGIGLSLVRRLVELHGGSVEAHSEGPGKGSEFIVRLPVLVEKVVQEAVPPSSKGEQVSVAKYRLLVVDDLKDSADSLAMLLKMLGHEVHTAYDGEDAIIAAEKFHPEVVLLDIGMPKLDGHDACRRIRQEPWGKGMYVVALTGWGQEDDRRRTEDAGFNHHMVKPV